MFHHSKTLLASVIASLGLALAAPAFAQSVTPTGAFTAEGWGTVDNSGAGGIGEITCDVEFNGQANSDATFVITDADFTDGGGSNGSLCPLVSAEDLPWDGQIDSLTQVTIEDVRLSAFLQPDCGPDDVVDGWTNGDPNSTSDPALITFDNTMLGSCVIVEGELEVTHDATGVGLEFTP